AAAPRGALLTQALARPEPQGYAELGFELQALLPGLAPLEGAPIVARHRLSGAFTGAELLVRGTEREAFLAAESQRVRTTLGLVGGTLLLLLLGSGLLVRSVRRDAQSARDQRNFVSAVTHELKTPLASIRLLSELLAEGGLDEEQTREFANRMVGETERLDAMVRGVLELARAERGVDPSERERLAPADLAAEALERMGPVAEEAGADLTLSRAERLPALVGDRGGIVGVLVNLIDNAIKYGDLSEPVELRVDAEDERVRFHLLDRGPGVPAAARERIFEAFWRAADELTRERPGVGLGLALGRAVAEAHGGELRYAPRAGGGSEFVLELPAEDA
ncbi:MAG TPA: hypothetical protein DEA08_25845, partial [Planctomycetes bacterium]|nr:hypothetical protein [Planctomycetota bacterium]